MDEKPDARNTDVHRSTEKSQNGDHKVKLSSDHSDNENDANDILSTLNVLDGEDLLEVDRKNPAFIPKKGNFYEHDNRLDELEQLIEAKTTNKQQLVNKPRGVKKAASDSDRWKHDRFDAEQQLPKTTKDIVRSYGYDIRREQQHNNSSRQTVANNNNENPRRPKTVNNSNNKLKLDDYMENNLHINPSTSYNQRFNLSKTQKNYNNNNNNTENGRSKNVFDDYILLNKSSPSNGRPRSKSAKDLIGSNMIAATTVNFNKKAQFMQKRPKSLNEDEYEPYKEYEQYNSYSHHKNNSQQHKPHAHHHQHGSNTTKNYKPEQCNKLSVKSQDATSKQQLDIQDTTKRYSTIRNQQQNNTNHHHHYNTNTSNTKTSQQQFRFQNFQQQQPYINNNQQAAYYDFNANWKPVTNKHQQQPTQVHSNSHYPQQQQFHAASFNHHNLYHHQFITSPTGAPQFISPQLPQYYSFSYMPDYTTVKPVTPSAQPTSASIFYAPNGAPTVIQTPIQPRQSKAIPIINPETSKIVENKN